MEAISVKWIVLSSKGCRSVVRVVAKVWAGYWFRVEGRVISKMLGVKLKHDFLFDEIPISEHFSWFAENIERFAENRLALFLELARKVATETCQLIEILDAVDIHGDILLRIGWAGELAWALSTFLRAFSLDKEALASALEDLLCSEFDFNKQYVIEGGAVRCIA